MNLDFLPLGECAAAWAIIYISVFCIITPGHTGNVPTLTFRALSYVHTQVNLEVLDGIFWISRDSGIATAENYNRFSSIKDSLCEWMDGYKQTDTNPFIFQNI